MTASQRRRASWQWLWSVDAWFPALAAVLLVGVLGTLFLSGGLRVLCAVVLGVSATYFATLLVGLRRVRVDQQVRVTLDDDGIAWSTPLAESRAAWRSVQRLDLTRDFAFARAGRDRLHATLGAQRRGIALPRGAHGAGRWPGARGRARARRAGRQGGRVSLPNKMA